MACKSILYKTAIWRRSMTTLSNKIVHKRFDGKTAVLTASTDGIGLAAARRLGQEGCNIVISSRKDENVQRAVAQLKDEGLQVHGIKCHVSSSDDRKRLFELAAEKFGGIDILVSNAGVNPSNEMVLQCTESKWDKIFDVNVKSSFMLTKEVVPYIRKRGGGSILYMGSVVAYTPSPILGAYGVSRTALLGLTKAASLELGPEGIRVNCFAPGSIATNFGKVMHNSEEKLEYLRQVIPLGRLGEPEEIGGVVAFLASDDASYITGETITIAGGYVSRL